MKVAENALKQRMDTLHKEDQAKIPADRKHKVREKQAVMEAVEMILPPDMPIIIDEQAVEDILGVSGHGQANYD